MQEASAMKSWLTCDNGAPLQNIPFGAFRLKKRELKLNTLCNENRRFGN